MNFPALLAPCKLSLDIHSDSIALLLRRDTVLEVNRERRTHSVLDVVDVVDPYFFIEFDVINRADIVGLRIVERPRREGLHV